jgi:hypothetical protein
MMDKWTNFNLTAMSTGLLLSILALLVSITAFLVLYTNDDSFWAVLWLFALVPATIVVVIVLTIRDELKQRHWRQTISVVVLLGASAFLVSTASSLRFVLHQLFTFRPIDLHLPENGLVLLQKFTVCPQGQSCQPRSTSTETRSFKLKKIPDGCCSLYVINRRSDDNAVDAFRIVLNGNEVKLPVTSRPLVAPVDVRGENEITVQVSGASGAHIYVWIGVPRKNGSLRSDSTR